MLAGPALSAFAILHSSECTDVVNVPGGNGAVAEERSSRLPPGEAIEEIAANPIVA
jgi:tripartite-type tricarboxylate transporter receptor subunit TctC